MDLFWNTFWRMPEQPSPAIQPRKKTSQVFDIPEILERIFYFTDEFTLRRAAVLVCREWFYMNVNLFPRTVYYENGMKKKQPELLVSRLTGAARLCCDLTVHASVLDLRDPFESNIMNVIVNSQEEYRKQLEKRSQSETHKPTIHSLSPLEDMTINVRHYIDRSLDTFPFPKTLTSIALYLQSKSSSADFNISRIVCNCPLLEELSVETLLQERITLTWDEPMTLHEDLALRSLTLNHISMSHAGLEHILSLTPKLKELEGRMPYLTTLELHWQRKGTLETSGSFTDTVLTACRLLFEYLCNSQYAVNLRVLKTGVFHHDMDLYGRGLPLDSSDITDNNSAPLQELWTPPGVWRCRNLRVLHINLQDPTSSMKRSAHSRIVFGYISRVAPQLEELEIVHPYIAVLKAPDHLYASKLCMQLEGGFCLLGRLRFLQRLTVYSPGGGILGLCKKKDLSWMVPSGQSDEFKEMRRQEIASWQSLRLVEDQCLLAQPQDGDISGDGASLDAELFRYLGLLRDVEEVINAIDAGSLVPFPSLVGVSFMTQALQGPQKKLERLFGKPKRGFRLW
ncbi:hypothetical protein BGZ96_004635 [Linnemannia gamsii]|uniref:F-box domain-containing protein n=1 Tax=Linnemannia gamsii TaxID=64522 RepID=A0ABQ7K5D6_9FUNG|nr:hypothetical protein BGZ96_004635 [Linnemannia gamsii]